MNTEEIDRVLRRVCAKDFDGVLGADTLPEKPRLLVINTNPAHNPGRHWCENGYGNFERYLNRHCSSWIFNRTKL